MTDDVKKLLAGLGKSDLFQAVVEHNQLTTCLQEIDKLMTKGMRLELTSEELVAIARNGGWCFYNNDLWDSNFDQLQAWVEKQRRDVSILTFLFL